jgi:hypothetical protein
MTKSTEWKETNRLLDTAQVEALFAVFSFFGKLFSNNLTVSDD